MEIKSHSRCDATAIQKLFDSVFTGAEGKEAGKLVGALAGKLINETSKDDLFGFIATESDEITGAVFFSRIIFRDDTVAFLLSPLAVLTKRQRQGIGQTLIRHGLKEMEKRGVNLVITYGNPRYYTKTGFHPLAPGRIKPPFKLSQPQGWLGKSISGPDPRDLSGQCTCVHAFDDPVYW